jgi:hypothetical protein
MSEGVSKIVIGARGDGSVYVTAHLSVGEEVDIWGRVVYSSSSEELISASSSSRMEF